MNKVSKTKSKSILDVEQTLAMLAKMDKVPLGYKQGKYVTYEDRCRLAHKLCVAYSVDAIMMDGRRKNLNPYTGFKPYQC